MNIPLVSNYKAEFITQRLLETFLGGLRLELCSEVSRSTSYILLVCEIFIFLIPGIIGICFIVLIEFDVLSVLIASSSGAIIMALFVAVATLITRIYMKKSSSEDGTLNQRKYLLHLNHLLPLNYKKLDGILICHLLFASIIIGLAIEYVRPSQHHLYSTASLFVFLGWFTVCSAIYSITVRHPPETAIYSSNESYILRSLTRPVHVLILLAVGTFTSCLPELELFNGILMIMFAMLPLFWLFGLLPPLPILAHWTIEQLNTIVCGGSPMSTPLIATLNLTLSVLTFSLCYSVQYTGFNDVFAVILASVSGLCLSNDLTIVPKTLNSCKFKPIFLFLTKLVGVIMVVIMINLSDNPVKLDVQNNATITVSILEVFVIASYLLRESTFVYIFAGIFRNPLYPNDMENYEKYVSYKNMIGMIRFLEAILIKAAIPFIAVGFVTVNLTGFTVDIEWFYLVLVVRIFRRIWTDPYISTVTIIIGVHFGYLFGDGTHFLVYCFVIDNAIKFFYSFIDRLYLVLSLMLTSVIMKKQRLAINYILFTVDVILFPCILILVLISTLLSAPIIPLFTLPIFLVGFPRPARFWTGKLENTVNDSTDGVYYTQLIPYLVKRLEKDSRIFAKSEPGDYYLARFQDRIIWFEVLEKGYGYVKIRAKGLELQETSCHAIEATQIDEILQNAFNVNSEPLTGISRLINMHYFYVIQPLDTVFTQTYSDARNLLTGVIDSPDFVILVKQIWPKIFLWVLIFNRLGYKVIAVNSDAKITEKVDDSVVPMVSQTVVMNGPIIEELESPNWSDEEDFLGPESSSKNQTSFHLAREMAPVYEPRKILNPKLHESFNESTGISSPSLTRNHSMANHSELAPPIEWVIATHKFRTKHKLNREANEFMFSEAWLESVLKKLSTTTVLDSSSFKSILLSYRDITAVSYSSVFPSAQTDLFNKHRLSPSTIYELFEGLWPANEWTQENEIMRQSILKSFQYTIKIAMDLMLISGTNELHDDELINILEDYEKNWHFGKDVGSHWEEAVVAGKPFLFSIGRNLVKDSYTSHLLSMQMVPVHVSKLRRSTIEGIFSSLSLELLYLTNDDEERYSIQAHPVVLRNLTVQAADVPLGYPIYCSETIKINI